MINIGRVSTAMVTPFKENGEIDFEATTRLVQHLIQNGTDSLVVCGTTGESPTLTTNEKLQLLSHVVTVVNGRIPVIAGTGSNSTQASIELTKKAEELGVDGIMLVVPYYNKPSQEGLYQHFKTIAEHTSLPIMLYNIPGRTSVNMDADTIVRLAEIENIVAVKEASGDLLAMTEIIERTPTDFVLYSGDDGLALPILAIGGKGVVSVAAHIVGNELQEMIVAFENGALERAQYYHQQLLPVIKALFMAPNPTAVKEALQLYDVPVGGVRLPLIPLSKTEKEKLSTVINTLHTKLV
ncbi:MAG: 4-hydroxy-tetrahydrodipicolinate synthase [Bacillaceae bacterium]